VSDVARIEWIRLRRQGEHAIVEVEVDGVFHELIREHVDGPFSHETNMRLWKVPTP